MIFEFIAVVLAHLMVFALVLLNWAFWVVCIGTLAWTLVLVIREVRGGRT